MTFIVVVGILVVVMAGTAVVVVEMIGLEQQQLPGAGFCPAGQGTKQRTLLQS